MFITVGHVTKMFPSPIRTLTRLTRPKQAVTETPLEKGGLSTAIYDVRPTFPHAGLSLEKGRANLPAPAWPLKSYPPRKPVRRPWWQMSSSFRGQNTRAESRR